MNAVCIYLFYGSCTINYLIFLVYVDSDTARDIYITFHLMQRKANQSVWILLLLRQHKLMFLYFAKIL